MHKKKFIDNTAPEHEMIMDIVEFAAYCAVKLGNSHATISNKLSAIKFMHLTERGVHLPTNNDLIRRQLKGIQRAQLDSKTRALRLPITMFELLRGGGGDRVECEGGRTLHLCLMVAFFVGARAHELFENDAGKIHPIHCLTRRDIAFFDDNGQLYGDQRRRATRVEIRYRGSKGDQNQEGSVHVRTRPTAHGPTSRLEASGGAVAVLVELLSRDSNLSEHAPLAAYRKGGEVKVWKYRQATRALKQIAQRVGMDSSRVSLHSLRIGFGSVLAAGGTSEHVTQREGRWAAGTDTFKVYTRNNLEDSEAVSKRLTRTAVKKQRLPGVGTRWER